jgi:membrane-associated phospholipid phosphatase
MEQIKSKEFKRFALFVLVILAWIGTYFSINALTEHRLPHVFSGNLESHVPFLPVFVVFYFSTYLLAIMPYFLVRDLERFKKIVYGALIIIFVSSAVFLIYPVAHPRPETLGQGFLSGWVTFLYSVDKPYNCFPSLHLSMATLAALFCSEGNWRRGIFFTFWTTMVALSTLFVKQHYLVDIVGGVLLAFVVYYFISGSRRELKGNKI